MTAFSDKDIVITTIKFVDGDNHEYFFAIKEAGDGKVLLIPMLALLGQAAICDERHNERPDLQLHYSIAVFHQAELLKKQMVQEILEVAEPVLQQMPDVEQALQQQSAVETSEKNNDNVA